jgi:sugar lactone lactonase YvrE
MVLLAIAATAGLGARASATGVQPTVLISFDPAQQQLPESMTSDDHGTLYASNLGGQVQKIDPVSGTFVTVATIPVAALGAALTGIKVGPDGMLYVVSASFSPTPAGAFLWRVNPNTGDVQKFATFDPTGFPNDLVFEDDGSILLTDPFLAQIYKIDTAGNTSVWLADPLFAGDPNAPAFGIHAFGIDGIAWDRNKKNLFVSTVDFGRVMRIPTDGCAPTIQVIAESPTLKGIDGIAVDRSGTIWAAVNTQDQIATVDSRGNISVISQGSPLDGPSSFAFGTGQHDKKTLYIANFAITRFLTGQTAHPGILSIPVLVPGLPLR